MIYKRCYKKLPLPPDPCLYLYDNYHDSHAYNLENRKYLAESDFWNRMLTWVRNKRKGEMPYPKGPKPPKPLKWWQFLKPLDGEEEDLELARFIGEVMEFEKWIPWTIIRKQ